MTMNEQMELGFENGRWPPPTGRQGRRQGRARWWFERMRQVVDRALDWQPAPAPRPEQIWFPATQPKDAGVRRVSEEQQVCE